MIQEPYIVITGAYKDEVGGDVQSTHVRLSGEYRVRVPSKYDAEAGFDRLLEYPDDFNQEQYTPRGFYSRER